MCFNEIIRVYVQQGNAQRPGTMILFLFSRFRGLRVSQQYLEFLSFCYIQFLYNPNESQTYEFCGAPKSTLVQGLHRAFLQSHQNKG